MIGLNKIVKGTQNQRQVNRDAAFYTNLIRHEAKIGGSVFGPVPVGVKREFFCLDENTWIWHEEWTENGNRKVRNTRYDVRPDGILKSIDGRSYQHVSHAEAGRLLAAAKLYQKKIREELYDAYL